MNIHTIVKALVNKIQLYKCKITIILVIAFEHQNFRMQVSVNTHPHPCLCEFTVIIDHCVFLGCMSRANQKSGKLVFILVHTLSEESQQQWIFKLGIYLDDFIFPVLLLFSLCISESKITSKPFSWYTNFNRT